MKKILLFIPVILMISCFNDNNDTGEKNVPVYFEFTGLYGDASAELHVVTTVNSEVNEFDITVPATAGNVKSPALTEVVQVPVGSKVSVDVTNKSSYKVFSTIREKCLETTGNCTGVSCNFYIEKVINEIDEDDCINYKCKNN